MAKHFVELKISVVMDEMDGSSEESAEIALNLIDEAIRNQVDNDANVEVTAFGHFDNRGDEVYDDIQR